MDKKFWIKLIGFLALGFAVLAPKVGLKWDDMAQMGVAALGTGLVGVITNGFGKTTSAVFTTIAGFTPGIAWLVMLIFGVTITPDIFNWADIGITIVIAKLDGDTDLPSWVDSLLQEKMGLKPAP